MATVSSVVLTPTKITTDPTKLRVNVKYILQPSAVEKLAGSVFQSTITLHGDDFFIDPQLTLFNDGPFAVSTTTPAAGVPRSRTLTLSKSLFNEDPETSSTGSEVGDEVYARVAARYVANAPNPLPPIAPQNSPVVFGTWK
jgi:hypothetical protein